MRIKRGIASLLVFFSLVSIFQYSIVEATTLIESTDEVSIEDDNAIGKKLIIRSIIKNADNEVVVSWDEVEGAEYQVMINSDIVDVKENYITSKQVYNQEYYYKVRYKLGEEYSLWSDVKAYTYEENNLRMSKTQNASYPYISGSAYGTKGQETKWHDFSSEGGNVYSINLDSPIEIVKFNVNNKVKDLQIQYRAYISQDKAWTDWKNEGEEAGTKGKTISAISIKYVSSDQSAFIRYSTIDSNNVQSAYYNNEESYGKPEELSEIKGIKVYLDTDYTKLQNDEIWKSGVTKDIKGTYEIPEGRTLTIESGAKINFSNDVGEKAGFVIKGNLIIKGTSTSKVEIKSDNNDMNIDVKYTGNLKADNLKISSKELNDNSIINVYGNIDISNYELSSSNTAAVVSKGIVFDQDRFNNKPNTSKVYKGKIQNLKTAIDINCRQDGIDIQSNIITNNKIGIEINNNALAKNEQKINIYKNSIDKNDSAIIVNQYSFNKDKSYKSINIESNSIHDNTTRGIGLLVDGLSNISITKNNITGTNIKKDKKDETGNELIGGPITLEKSVLDEDNSKLLEGINSEKNKNTLTGNNYDTVILDRVSLAETAQVSISKGSYSPLISDYLKIYKNTVLNINGGTHLKVRGGKESIINIKGVLNFDGSEDNKVAFSTLSTEGIGLTGDLNNNDKISTRIFVDAKGTLIGNGLNIENFNISKGNLLEVAENAGCVLKNTSISNTNGDYAISVKGDSSILSKINITNTKSKGIECASDNALIENVDIDNVAQIGINIFADDVIIKNCNINNITGTTSFGIKTASETNGTLVSESSINGVTTGIYTSGKKATDNRYQTKYAVIVEGSKITAKAYGIEINSDMGATAYKDCIIQVTGSEITGYRTIYGGMYNAGRINLILKYNKIISLNSKSDRTNRCIWMGDYSTGVVQAQNNSFIQYDARYSMVHLYFKNKDWNISIDSSAFAVGSSGGIDWNGDPYISVSSGEAYPTNVKKYDVSKFGVDINIDISTIIDKIINDNQYLIRKLFGQEGITSSTGNFSFNRTDLALDSAGVDFAFTRTYNSMNNEAGMLGKGWTFSYESNLKKKEADGETTVAIQLPNGSAETYLLNDNKYKALDSRNKLAFENNQYTLKDNTGSSYIFNEAGKLVNQIDKYGNKVTFEYDSKNRISKISDNAYRVYTFDYSVANKITVKESIDGKANRSFTYNLNSNGQLQSVTDVAGKITEVYSYYGNEAANEGFKEKIKSIDSKEKDGDKACVDTVNYNTEGKVDTYIESTGRITKYVYDKEKKQTEIGIGKALNGGGYEIDKSQIYQTEYYDRNGLVYKRDYSDGTFESQAFNYSYTEKFKQKDGKELEESILVLELLEERDREGRLFKYEYDSYGNVNKIINPDNSEIIYEYDVNGNLLKEINEEKIQKGYTYHLDNTLKSETVSVESEDIKDDKGNLVKESLTNYEKYNETNTSIKGLVGKKTNPNGSYSEFKYDKYGYLSNTIDEGKHDNTNKYTNVTVYNGQGLRTDEYVKAFGTDKNEIKTSYTYDKFGNQITKTYNGVSKETTNYDNYQRKVKVIDPMGDSKAVGTTLQYYPGTKLVWKQIDAKGNTTEFVYDKQGRVEETINANGRIDIVKYDDLDRIISKLYKDTRNSEEVLLESISYTNSNGNTNIVTKKYIDSNKYIIEVVEKDWRGNVTKFVDGESNTKSTTYTSTGDVKTETTADGGFKQYNYNDRGLISAEYVKKYNADSKTFYEYKEYKYDVNGRVICEGTGLDFTELNVRPKKLSQKNIIYFDNDTEQENNYSISQIVDGQEKVEPKGNKVVFNYDKQGNKISEITQKNEKESIKKTWVYYYNRENGLYSVTEILTLDKSDLGTEETDDTGTTEIRNTKIFNLNNKLTYEENFQFQADRRRVVYTYDELNNIIQEDYYKVGELGSELKETKKRSYNEGNKLESETDENEFIQRYKYDSRYNLISKSNNYETTMFGYDNLGRAIWESNQLDMVSAMSEGAKLENTTSDTESYKSLYDLNNDGVIDVFDLSNIAIGAKIINKTIYHYNNVGFIIAKEKEYGSSSTGKLIKELTAGYKVDSEGRIIKEVSAQALDENKNGSLQERIEKAYGTEYIYDFQGEVISVREPENKVPITVSYDNAAIVANKDKEIGRIKLEKYEKGNYRDTLDTFGNVKKTEVIEGTSTTAIETNSYDYVGNLISQIDGKNNEYKYTYNNLGLLKTEVLPNDESIDKNTIVHRYNAFGEEVFNKDSIGKMTITTRDFEGKVTKEEIKSASFVPIEQKVNYSTTYDYIVKDGNSTVTITDRNGKKSSKIFDAMGRLRIEQITVMDVNGVSKFMRSITNYFAGDLVSHMSSPYGGFIENKYDAFGRIIEKRNENKELIEELSYNKNGLQTFSVDGLGNTTTFNYDKNNRLIETIDAENNKTTQSYDSNGNVVRKIDAKQNITDYTYDLRNRLKEVKLQKGTGVDTYDYQYDENNNLTRVQDGEGRVKIYDYNSLNQIKTFKEVELSGMNNVDKYTESYSYYANGSNKSKSINGVENKTYKNDILGRTKEEKSKSDIITTKYDNNNNILEVKNSSDTITRTFDELNRVKTKTSLGKTLKFTYDDTEGLVYGYHAEKIKDFNNNETTRIYDAAGRVIKSIDNKVETNFNYYPNGNKKSVEYESGVKEEYSYNKNNSLTKLVNKKGDEILSEYNYTYDANNLLETKVDSKGKTSYSYDKQNRLEVVKEPNKTVTYTYDGAGNRKTEQVSQNGVTTNSTYQYNSTNKLEKVETKQGDKVTSTKTYLYDKKGNVQAELESSKGTELKEVSTKSIEESIKQSNGRGILSENVALNDAGSKAVAEDTYKYFSYDDNNNMIAVKDKAGKVISSSKYNAEGLRVQQTTSEGTTNYIYEGNNPILELDANKNVVAKNEYVGNTLLSRNIKNIKYNYLYNGHGDVVNLVNNKGGIENTYYYDSFGNIEESSEKVKNPFKYSKYEHDVETGLYYLKSRMYDPTTARFMQMDTYKGQSNDPLSLNLYTYCVNEPMMYHDPDGHNPLLVLALIIGGGMIGVGGEYLGDRLDDGIINTDLRHYVAAFAAGSIELPLRYAVGSMNANPYVNFSIDIGSNLLYQYMAGEDISVKNAAINATIGFGINGLGRVSSKVYKVGINKISDALMPKINKLIPNFAPKIENIISGLNVKTNKILSKIDSFINKASNKVNSMISNVTPTSTKSSTLITDTIDNKLNLNKPLMMDLQLFSLKRGVSKPDIGKKLEYVFGNATGNKHNIERSLDMENKLNKIGIFDNAKGRTFMENQLQKTFNNTTNGILQDNGRIMKESLLTGPNGVAKMQSVWDGDRLITVEIFKSDWKSFVK